MNYKLNEENILRWGLVERFEHHTAILIMFTLIISGLPIFKIEWFSWMVIAPITIDIFRIIHLISAGLFFALAIFHILYHTLALRKTGIMVTFKDIRESIVLLKYYMGLTEDEPRLTFHNPTEKIFVYWLMTVLFMLFMAVSGLILLLPSYFPIWGHEWALIIHDTFFYLIFFVLIVHFYMSVLYKDYKPLLESIFTTGLISAKFVKKHHPLWYEEIMKEKESK